MSANFKGKKGAPARAQNSSKSQFNARGVVERPVFALQILPSKKFLIGITVRAYPVENGWIAEAETWVTSGSLLGDCQYPNLHSRSFKTRSEAVEDALNRAVRNLGEQLGAQAAHPKWAKQLALLSTQVRDRLVQVRDDDEGLPLRGKTFIDLCAGGLAGFGIALNQLGAKCVLACEIDPVALSSYVSHVGPQATHGDVCTLDGKQLKADLVVVGMICQAYSAAGKHLGMADPTLADVYRNLLRVLGEIDAKVIVIECARQLLTHKDGKDAALVRETLMRAGYRVQHRTLDAARFGVPQHRERSFIVATRIGAATDAVLGYCFPEGAEPTAVVADVLEPNQPGIVYAKEIKSRTPAPQKRSSNLERVGLIKGKDCQGNRVYHTLGIGQTLCASSGGACPQTGAYLMEDGNARPLTPREAYRMQGMPEWTQPHANRRAALKHAGNGVAVPVVREIARAISTQLFLH